ncbi:unnamed protein product, partial [Brassica rapa]
WKLLFAKTLLRSLKRLFGHFQIELRSASSEKVV